MARTTKNDVLIPTIFNEAVASAFAQKTALMSSGLVSTGACVVAGDFGGDARAIGDVIQMPYFGNIGEFQQNLADGTPLTPVKIASTGESATVTRDGLAFEVTRWANGGAGMIGGVDPYTESANQVVEATGRAMDRRVIDAAVAPGGMVKSAFSASSPRTLDYDLLVDSALMWGDENDGIATLVVHSKTRADLLKLKDAMGRPLLTNMQDGKLAKFLDYNVVTSDRLPLTGSTMGAVTPAGTAPPTLTITGTPNGPIALRILVTVAGALGTSKFKFSTDDGNTYSAELTTASTVLLTDPTVDSLIGANGNTGLTANWAAGTASIDNVYTSKAVLKVRSLIVQPRGLAFWFNKDAIKLATDHDILADSQLGSIHLYSAAKRYRRRPGGTKPGVVTIEHNVGAIL